MFVRLNWREICRSLRKFLVFFLLSLLSSFLVNFVPSILPKNRLSTSSSSSLSLLTNTEIHSSSQIQRVKSELEKKPTKYFRNPSEKKNVSIGSNFFSFFLAPKKKVNFSFFVQKIFDKKLKALCIWRFG